MATDLRLQEGGLQSADGTRLHYRSWTVDAPKAAVAVAHGLGEHSGRYAGLAEALNRRGFDCHAVDLRGMGKSAGRRGHVAGWQRWVEDYAAFHDLVKAKSGASEVVPLGHSFGGVVVASAILCGAVEPRRFVLSNPAFRPAIAVPGWKVGVGRVASRLLPTLTLANELDPATVSRDPAVVAAYKHDPLVHDRVSSRLFTEWSAARVEALERASEIAVPFLLIVSDADRLIDPEGALEFNRRADSGQTLRVYRGRYHEPFNDLGREEVFADLTAWLDAPPPSTLNGQDVVNHQRI
ncbi:MAG: lysophospholipase [Candidatus Dormibacteraeota bacterium]|nr:lysophospholipase [Candidatus Dormibacteraeota bacterium]